MQCAKGPGIAGALLRGATPGKFYEYDEVSQRTPDPEAVNIRMPA